MTMMSSLIKKPSQTIQFWGVRLDIPGDPSVKGRGGEGGGVGGGGRWLCEDCGVQVLEGSGDRRLQGLFIKCGVKIPGCIYRGHGKIPEPNCMQVDRFMCPYLGRVGDISGPK